MSLPAIQQSPAYGNLVNFSDNLTKPIHNWFNLKEGYSSQLVTNIINSVHGTSRIRSNKDKPNHSQIDDKEIKVFDPFSGCGTTLLTAKENKLDFLGFEINPFLHTLVQAKIENYDPATMKDILKHKLLIPQKARSVRNPDVVELSISQKLFGGQLKTILQYRQVILKLRNPRTRSFFLIAFLSILESCSYAKKDGNGLRYPPQKETADFVKTFNGKVERMIQDLTYEEDHSNNGEVILGDCRGIKKSFLRQHASTMDISIFSPPYLNCFDYTEIYKIELWFGGFVNNYSDLKMIRNESLTSHLNKEMINEGNITFMRTQKYIDAIKKQDIWSPKIPSMIANYFSDMHKVIKNVYQLLKEGGYCVIIVGNSAYGKIVIPTDEIIMHISEDIGFKPCSIKVARKLNTSPQQQKKVSDIDKLRESLVFIRK